MNLAKKVKKGIEMLAGDNYNNDKEQARKEREREKDLQRLGELRPMDDEFMRCMFRGNKPLVQHVLRTITKKKDLVVEKCEVQLDMKRLAGSRSVILDVYARDSKGRIYDIEIQIAMRGAGPHRARYYASVQDVENLREGQDFDELPETYVIFITEKDIYGKELPVYHVERKIEELGNQSFGDNVHILYVNGQYEGDDPIGELMHDFNCKDPNEMRNELMRERAKSLKESEKGVKEVSSVLEEMRAEAEEYGMQKGMEKGLRETALRMLSANKFTQEEVASYSGLSLDEVKLLASEVTM